MIIPVYLLFQIIHLETSDSALPPYYVVLCQYYTDKTVGANQQHLSGSQSRTFQTAIALGISMTKISLPVRLWRHCRYISWNAASAELNDLLFYTLLNFNFYLSCAFGTGQFHHLSFHTSFPLCKGLSGKLLLTTHLSQICCRLAGRFFTEQTK